MSTPNSLFPIATKPLAFLFLILDMALQVFLHKTAITKVFLPGVGVEKGPTNRMKQARTEEPSVIGWGNVEVGREDRKSEEEMHSHMTRYYPMQNCSFL